MTSQRRRLIVGGLTAAAMVVVLGLTTGDEPEDLRARPLVASSLSARPWGAKALFLLLQRSGLQAERGAPADLATFGAGDTLWSLAPGPPSPGLVRDLLALVHRGGSVVAPPRVVGALLARATLGGTVRALRAHRTRTRWPLALDSGDETWSTIDRTQATAVDVFASTEAGEPLVAAWGLAPRSPGEVGRLKRARAAPQGSSARSKRGRIILFGAPGLLENRLLGRGQNAAFVVRLAYALGFRHRFLEPRADAGQRGLAELLVAAPYRWSVLQLALALVAALVVFGRRRYPIEPLPGPRRREAVEHVDAVARLWLEAGDARLPLRALLAALEHRARGRLAHQAIESPFVTWVGRVRPSWRARASTLWAEAEALLAASPSASLGAAAERRARRVAAALAQLEKEVWR